MNRTALALILGFLLTTGAFKSDADPVRRPAYFKVMYIPDGYDSNDLIQIVGEGVFNNSCYRQAETHVRIDDNQKKIFLGPVAYSYPGICLMVMLPYQKTISLGLLKAGKWEIVQETNKIVVGEINVNKATTENADDYLYAPISQAFFYQITALGRVMLTGEFTNSCMHMDEVKVKVESNVIVVQPIAVMEQRADCRDGKFPFTHNTIVKNIRPGRYLLHVRSLNGNAINSLVDFN